MKNICIFSAYAYPERKGGIELRYYELSGLLRSKGYNVTLFSENIISPSRKIPGSDKSFLSKVNHLAKTHDIFLIQPDILYFYHEILKNKILIVDLICPFHIEHRIKNVFLKRTQRKDEYRFLTEMFIFSLKYGDYFLCGNKNQYEYYSSLADKIKRKNFRTSLKIVGQGIQNYDIVNKNIMRKKNENEKKDNLVFIWFGGIWDWYDPLTLLKGFKLFLKNKPYAKLLFVSGKTADPLQGDLHKICIKYSEDNGLSRNVFFIDEAVPYEKRFVYLKKADAAVISFKKTIEAKLSQRFRNTDFINAGLPVISSEGDSFSTVIKKNHTGCVVKPQSETAWNKGFLKMSSSFFRQKCRLNLLKLRKNYSWDEVIKPLLSLCKKNKKNPDAFSSGKTFTPLVNKKIVIFGASKAGIRALSLCRSKGAQIKYFVDNDILKNNCFFENIKIYSPEKLKERDFDTIVIASFPGRDAIERQLQSWGFNKTDYIWFGNL